MSEIVKKVVVPQSELPVIGKILGTYVVRYRIISEDRNRASHWSPSHILETTPLVEIPHTVSKDNSNDAVEVFWTPPSNLGLNLLDVYVKWGSGDWAYATNLSSTYYKVSIPNGATSVQVAVQVPTKEKVRSESATLFESESYPL